VELVKEKTNGNWLNSELTSRQVHPRAQDGELWEQPPEKWTWVAVGGEDTIKLPWHLQESPTLLISKRSGRPDEKEAKAVLSGQWETMDQSIGRDAIERHGDGNCMAKDEGSLTRSGS